MRRLMLLRHSKTENDAPSGRDQDRRLDDRGRLDAAEIGGWIARHPPFPDTVLVSPAVLIPPADRSYRLVWRALEAAFPDADEAEIKARAVIMVSTSHGFLALDQAGRFKPFMYEPMTHDGMVEAVMRSAMRVG